jgi:hypothetical protein
LEGLLVRVCFDQNHVHGFAGLEAGAVHIDIGKGLVILAIDGEGCVVRHIRVVGLGNASGSQIGHLRGERFV